MKENKYDIESSDLRILKEGSADFYIPAVDDQSIPSKSMEVFYNKIMELNRDVTNSAINAYFKLFNQKGLVIVDSMAASGISSIRIIKECEHVKKIFINDINPIAVDLIRKNIALNKIDVSAVQIEICEKDANFLFAEIAQNSFLNSNSEQQKPNVISIDPFGTPSPYVSSAFNAIQRNVGLMCVTATDTAVLFGVRPNACIRKYMSKPLHVEYCKEIGARILVYFLSRIANVNKLGIIPLLTFYANHFIRVFLLTFKDKKKISSFFNNYGYIIHCINCGHRQAFQDNYLHLIEKCPLCCEREKLSYAGPLWIGDLHEKKFLDELILTNKNSNHNNKKRIEKLLNLALGELNMPISYYNIHKLSQKLKTPIVPKIEDILVAIRKKGYKVSRTHFDFLSIKTNMDVKSLSNCLLELCNNIKIMSKE